VEVQYTCPRCGTLRGTLEVLYDYDEVKKKWRRPEPEEGPHSHWRYLPLLPINQEKFITPLKVGWTPLYRAESLERELGLRGIWIKDEGVNPTGSLKDRASSVAVVNALEKKKGIIVAASTGNAASSLSAFAASSGIESYIFVPKGAPRAKVAQLLVYGARVFEVDGTYDDAYELSLELSLRRGWYSRNTAHNPFLGEGKKTAALEICEQLSWKVPRYVIVPVGDGCIIQGIWKGFKDFLRIGFIDSLPKIIGVQAEGSSPLAKAFLRGKEEVEIEEVETVADSIKVACPRDQVKALKAVRESGGTFITVTDEEILDAIPYLARRTGVFGEPAGVAGVAGLKKLVERGGIEDGNVVIIMTGNGLKDIESVFLSVKERPIRVSPRIEDFEKKLEDIGNGN
jgi:threonine synthase